MAPETGKIPVNKTFVEPSIDYLNFAKLGKKLDDHKILYHFQNTWVTWYMPLLSLSWNNIIIILKSLITSLYSLYSLLSMIYVVTGVHEGTHYKLKFHEVSDYKLSLVS